MAEQDVPGACCRRDTGDQVPDGSHVKTAQAAEDVPDEYQDPQVEGGRGPRQPAAAEQRDDDRCHHHIRRPDVDEVPVTYRQLPRVHPVGDDALAHQRPDHVPGQADGQGPPVAERMVGTEQGERDQHRPGNVVALPDERRRHQREDRIVLQVGHAGACPCAQGVLR